MVLCRGSPGRLPLCRRQCCQSAALLLLLLLLLLRLLLLLLLFNGSISYIDACSADRACFSILDLNKATQAVLLEDFFKKRTRNVF